MLRPTGRDADTVAAIAGGLVGAAYGASVVPNEWRDSLHGWHDWHDMGSDAPISLSEPITRPYGRRRSVLIWRVSSSNRDHRTTA